MKTMRSSLLLVVVFTMTLPAAFLLSACQPQALPKPTAVPYESPSAEAVIGAWQEALNAGDIDTALAQLTDDATIEILPPPPGIDGVFTGH